MLLHICAPPDLCSFSQPIVGFTIWERSTSAHNTFIYTGSLPWLQWAAGKHGIDPLFACLAWANQAWIRPTSALWLHISSLFSVLAKQKSEEDGRLKLELIPVHFRRRHFSFQLNTLACIPICFYIMHYIACVQYDGALLFRSIWIFQVGFPETYYHAFQDM